MEKIITFSVAFMLSFGCVFAHSVDTISVPLGTTPTIDGTKSVGEWTDAFLISILNNGFYNDIYIKHSTTHLFVAFESPYSGSTGIYIDKLHNGGVTPQTDDIWIHGSTGPFEFVGNSTTSWQQQSTTSNWDFVESSANQISEYQILLSKLGITSGTNTLGVLFSFIDWSMSQEITWSFGGYPNCGNPNTWANMIISLTTSVEEHYESNNKIKVYPNFETEYLTVDGLSSEKTQFSIFNIVGQSVIAGDLDNNSSKISIASLNSGIYFIKINTESKTKTIKFIKR